MATTPSTLSTPDYAFAPPAPPAVPIAGSNALYPVHRIYCVGRNYAAHAREMGADPTREPPFFFCKPADAVVVASGGEPAPVAYPSGTADLQHEVELVVAIGTGGAHIAPADALAHVWGYGVGLDLTRRDLQTQAKAKGHPWELGKGFDQSAPMSAITPVAVAGHPDRAAIWLTVDGVERQRGNLADQIWPVADVVSRLSAFFTLQPGDLIYTGTPEGVAPVRRGQVLRGGIDGLATLAVRIV